MTYSELRDLRDEDLIAHLERGNHDALAVIFDRYHRLVFSVAQRILRDAAEAEDVLQEIFLEVYRIAAKYDPARGTVRVWLLQFAYHRSLNRRQALTRRRFYDSANGSEHAASSHAIPERWNGLTRDEWTRAIRQGLDTLNERQRVTIELALFKQLTLREVAAEMVQPLGTVRHYYYRGLKRLRDILGSRSGDAARKAARVG
ncbi:MAG: sigma-70 family RNA polymerase sigma factor [Gammaproteobacteria bacterium]